MKHGVMLTLLTWVFGLTIAGCSSGLKLTSDWQQTELKMNGNDTDWQRGLYYDEEMDMVYGVRNDNQNVYLFIKTQNRATQMQILRSGFTVWFDPAGGKDRVVGVRYPLNQGSRGTHPPTEMMEDDQFNQTPNQSTEELEIVGPKSDDVQRNSALQVPGIRVKVSHSKTALVYELCMPLKKTQTHPFAIGFIPGKRIGIGFEGGDFKRPERKNEGPMPDRGGEPGGAPIGTEGVGGYGSPGRNGRHGEMPAAAKQSKTMKLWLSVQLAGTPTGGE